MAAPLQGIFVGEMAGHIPYHVVRAAEQRLQNQWIAVPHRVAKMPIPNRPADNLKHKAESFKIEANRYSKERSSTLVPEEFPVYDLNDVVFKEWLRTVKYPKTGFSNFHVCDATYL